MIRRKEEIRGTRKQAPFQGKGDITVRELLEGPGEMYQKGRVFAHTTVHPGAAIGYHVHEKESETYYILSGHFRPWGCGVYQRWGRPWNRGCG